MAGSAERMRQWRGPAVLSYGFRPFFLMAPLWAAAAMALWIAMLTGLVDPRLAFDPMAWHAHELVFGYTSAVIAGFVLTAVPNWTGRLPLFGAPLAGLAGLWLIGRVAVALPLPWLAAMAADLAFGVALVAVVLREIVAGGNWKNLPVAGLIALFTLANAGFHGEAASGLNAADGYGLRAGLGAVLMLIALIGGRIVPSFTRNWLAARKQTALPAPFSRLDAGVLAVTGAALSSFVAIPESPLAGGLSLLAGLANLWRLARWQGLRTGAEPLLWVLHLAYGLLALGFLTVGAAGFDLLPVPAARHVWMAGAVGLMTLAVMSRASLGHTGRALHAGPGLTSCYLAIAGAVAARLAAGVWGQDGLLHLSAALWMLGFGGFAVLYWPVLTGPRVAKKPVSGAARA